jgi:hypothetical protein
LNSKCLSLLKKVHYSLKDENGVYRDIPISIIGNANTSVEGLKRLKGILDLVLSSDKIYEGTKIFIRNNDMSIKEVYDKVESDYKSQRTNKNKIEASGTYSTVIKKIHNDNEKLIQTFGMDMIQDCIYNRISDFSEFDRKISIFIAEYGTSNNVRNNLMINIDDKPCMCNEYRGSEDFFEILNSIEPYLKERMTIIEEVINKNKEFVGYFNYLLNSISLVDDDIVNSDRERLLKFLNNEDYITGYEDTDDTDDVEDTEETSESNDYSSDNNDYISSDDLF